MGYPSTYIVYTSDSGGNYLVKQQVRLADLAGNTVATASNQYPGLPRNIRPRKAAYVNAGVSITLVYGSQSDYASAPSTLTVSNIAYKLDTKTAERVRVLRP